MNIGVQVDLELEQYSWATIPKVTVLDGSIDSVVLREAALAHLVVATETLRVELPDGRRIDGRRVAELGWADVLSSSPAAAETVVAALGLLPENGWSPPPIATAGEGGAEIDAGADPGSIVDHLVDGGTFIPFGALAEGSVAAGAGRIAGRTVVVVVGAPTTDGDAVRIVKALRVARVFNLPLITVEGSHDVLAAASPAREELRPLGTVIRVAATPAGLAAPAVLAGPAQVEIAWPDAAAAGPTDVAVEPAQTRDAVVQALENLGTALEEAGRARGARVYLPKPFAVFMGNSQT
jgi:membrane-associated protease RseP (regulator of RpoE activity)